MKILITGGAGFIGSHLCEKYINDGHTVICLDNFVNGNLTNIRHLLCNKNFKLVTGDVRDFPLVEKVTTGVDVTFHLAAQIHVDKSIVDPKLTYDVNVSGTYNILQASKINDVRRVIYASTSEVYGSAKHSPMAENHPLDAPHPYGASKIAADRLCNAYIQTYGMDICVVRPFNIFGPRQKDTGYGGVISIFTKRILSNMPPIIYGDGEQTRDYTYVEDIVRAYDLVMCHEIPIREPVNFGTGREVKIIDLANMLIRLCNMHEPVTPVSVEPRPGEVRRLIADVTRATSLLGWKPAITLEGGLIKFVEWYKNYRFEEWTKPG